MGLSETPYALSQFIDKLLRGIEEVDPKDPRFAAIFQNLPENQEDDWTKSIREVAGLVGLPPKSYSSELLRIAKEHGLILKNAKRMSQGDYFNLSQRANALRAIIENVNLGTGVSHSFGSPRDVKRKR